MTGSSDDGDQAQDYIERLNRFFERVGGWSYDHRWWVLAICLAVFATSIALAGRAPIDMTFAAFFDEKDPTYSAFLQYRDDFGSDELAYILYEAPDTEHGPFDLEVMRKIASLSEVIAEEVPFVDEVTSLANVEYMEAVEDGIQIYELLEEFPESQAGLLAIRDKVLDKPLYVGGLVSPDAQYAALIVSMDKSAVDPPEELRLDPQGGSGLENLYPQVSETALSEILARPEYAGITFYLSGEVPWNSQWNRIMIPETTKLTVITYFLIGGLLYFFFRRVMGVVGPFAVVTVAVAIAAGIVGIFRWNLDLMFPFVPNLLIAVGVANALHVVSEFNAYFQELGDRREAIRRTMYLVATPCLLASLTTASGLMAMSLSNIQTMAHMAIYSAVGVFSAFLLTVTLLMALFSFGRRGFVPEGKDRATYRKREGRFFDALLGWVAEFNIRHPKPVLLIALLIFAAGALGLSKLRVDTNFMDAWKDDEPIKQITLKVDDVMGGMSSVIYLFDTGEPDGIKDPAVLREIERVQMEADKQSDFVKKSYSIVDVVKDLNRTFHDGDPAYYKIPESRELVAQYLLLYEMSGGEEIGDYVSGDFSRANLELRCRMDAISRMAKLADNLDAHLEAQPLQHSTVTMTGIGACWLKFAQYITDSQIQGILLAFSVIAAMMCFIFRSVKIGLLSMIPNLTPVFLTLGAMGWIGMELDYTRLLVAPLAIGIAVDDTIHFVTRFHVAFQRCHNYAEALRRCFHDVGRALIGTTVVLVAGFLVNAFHGLVTQQIFGYLIAWTIFIALIADFFLMPALFMTLKPFGPEGNSEAAPSTRAKTS